MSMSDSFQHRPIWWDRETDSAGKPLRKDERDAAHVLWERACHQVKKLLGDAGDAACLMETSVSQVSRYLDRKQVTLYGSEASAILMCALGRNLRRYAAKVKRIELIADISELAESAPYKSCGPSKEDCRIDAEKVARRLNPRARVMLELRKVGFEWKEIAAVLKTTDCAARAEFSREVKKARATPSPGAVKNDSRNHEEPGCQRD